MNIWQNALVWCLILGATTGFCFFVWFTKCLIVEIAKEIKVKGERKDGRRD